MDVGSRRRFLKSALGVVLGARSCFARAKESALKRAIPSSGEAISAVGLGTWQAFDIAGDARALAEAREALQAFARLGGEVIDSSPMYGSAESVAGTLCADLGVHRQMFFATKVWTRGAPEGIRQMRDSMRRLRIELKGPLDLMQVHNLVDAQTHLATLAAWKNEGRIRYIGITHYHAGAHAELEGMLKKHRLDFLQVNYSLAEPQAEQRLLGAAAARGTAVIVNRPFAEGAMFERVGRRPLPGYARELGCGSWAQVFLKWILSNPAVTCVIPGTRSARHVADNLGALLGTLPDAALRTRIREEFQKL